jgi:60 kDa SS-A/Ro ribonucleoprotein
MGIKNVTQYLRNTSTPQTEAIPGANQVKNNAGGFVFKTSAWSALDRFLCLGSEGGSYYVGERKLTMENLDNVKACIKEDGPRTVAQIVKISDEGRAPKNDPAIMALALCIRLGDEKTKVLARSAVTAVCRIPTHLFSLAEALDATGGWGPSVRKALGSFYTQDVDKLAGHLIKYQSRNGWSNADLLRKTHVKAPTKSHEKLFRWSLGHAFDKRVSKPVKTGKIGTRVTDTKNVWEEVDNAKEKFLAKEPKEEYLKTVWAFETAKVAKSEKELVRLITEFNLPRECIPTESLNSVAVWEALLFNGKYGMPLTAMMRNLGKMTSVGLLKPLSKAVDLVVSKLNSAEDIKRARLHPLNILTALRTYGSGHGDKGSLVWTPVPQIQVALEKALHLSFDQVEATGKRFLFGLDVSGSMSAVIPGTSISSAEAGAVLALVSAKVEPKTHVFGFANSFVNLGITASDTVESATAKAQKNNFGSTDCSLPMQYALKNKLEVDVFVVITDNETYAGGQHPIEALREYRKKMKIDAKMVVIGTCSSNFTIADPTDAGSLDVVGFDTSVPSVLAAFAKD